MAGNVLWLGNAVFATVAKAVAEGLTEWGLKAEKSAKSQVSPGSGVLTGTYRRSVHSAGPSYNFAGDDVRPTPNSPERSGQGGGPEMEGSTVGITLGSGLVYARKVEDWYAPIEDGFLEVADDLVPTIEKHCRAAGLK